MSERRFGIYRLLLGLTPRGFRREYGLEMVRLHRERVSAYRCRSSVRRITFLLSEYLDLLRTAGREWWRHLQPAPLQASREPELTYARRDPEIMTSFFADLRFSLRTMLRRPGFSLLVVLTLTIGIGATTAVFSLVDTVLLRPLPFNESDRLVAVQNMRIDEGNRFNVTWNDYVTWRQEGVFEEVAVYVTTQVTVTGFDEPLQVTAAQVTDQFFSALQIEPVAGRLFAAEEIAPGAPGAPVVLIGYGFWQRAFGGEVSAVGSTIQVQEQSFEIVGVVPDEAEVLDGIELWAPYPRPLAINEPEWTNNAWRCLARLKGIDELPSVNAALEAIALRHEEAYPGIRQHLRSIAVPLLDYLLGSEARLALWLVLGAITFVLFIGCVNIANMQLAHASERGHEFAVRRAMGAGRRRLLRLHMTGSVLLALAGGATGTVLAAALIRILLTVIPGDIPRIDEAAINPSVLLFALAVSLGAAVLFGLLPGLRATSAGGQGLVSQAGSWMTAGRGQLRGRNLLVGLELVLSVMLLFGAGLLLRSLDNLFQVDPGFEHENLLTVGLSLPQRRYPDPVENVRHFAQIRAELVRLPMVEAATVRSMLSLGGGGFNLWRAFLAEGWAEPPAGNELIGPWVVVGDEHFQTVGLPLLRGRDFTPADDAESVPVMIINQVMAEAMFGDEDPIGKRVRSWRDENVYREIVGVVGNELMSGPDDIERSIVYIPHRQNPWRNMVLIIRTLGDSYAAVGAVREVLHQYDPNLPVVGFRTMEDALAASVASTTALTRLLSAFAAAALLLAAVGIFGVLSYVISLRRREIGIRLAVGADRNRIERMLLGETFRIVVVSLLIGLAGAQILGRLLSEQLFEVTPLDPLTLVSVAVIITTTALVATLVPAGRAARTDPMQVLRIE